jgi:hypothetical protein
MGIGKARLGRGRGGRGPDRISAHHNPRLVLLVLPRRAHGHRRLCPWPKIECGMEQNPNEPEHSCGRTSGRCIWKASARAAAPDDDPHATARHQRQA